MGGEKKKRDLKGVSLAWFGKFIGFRDNTQNNSVAHKLTFYLTSHCEL